MHEIVRKICGPLIFVWGGMFGASAALAEEAPLTDAPKDNEKITEIQFTHTNQTEALQQPLDLSFTNSVYSSIAQEFNRRDSAMSYVESQLEDCDKFQSVVKLCRENPYNFDAEETQSMVTERRESNSNRRIYLRMGEVTIEREKTKFSKSTALYFYRNGDLNVSVGRYTYRAPRVLGQPSAKQKNKGLRVQKRF